MKCGDERNDVEVRARIPRSLHEKLAAFATNARRDKSNAVCVLLDMALDAVEEASRPTAPRKVRRAAT